MKRFAIHGNARFMKTLNRTLVLSVIRELGPISRADIAKVTGLTRPTVTHIVQELLEEGVVVEGEAAPSTGGRKPILLHLNPSAYTVIGVDIGVRKVTAVAVDLAGHHAPRPSCPAS